jgi:hypothetical protein
MLRICLAVLALPLILVSSAFANPKVAIFPFEIRDAAMEGDPFAVPQEADLARLKLVADELKSLMVASGRFDVVDLSSYKDEIEKASPFYKCDGCEVDIAKESGADLAVTGFVDKVTDALMSLQIFVRNAGTGKMEKTMSAEIRGNTDDLWLHGIRYLWKNRFEPQGDK